MEVRILSLKLGIGFNVLYAPISVVKSCYDKIPALYLTSDSMLSLHQLIDALKNARENVIFIEHSSKLFKDVYFQDFEDFVSILRQISRSKVVVYFSSERDRIFDFITGLADRYIYVEEDAGGYYLAEVTSNGIEQKFYPKEPVEREEAAILV